MIGMSPFYSRGVTRRRRARTIDHSGQPGAPALGAPAPEAPPPRHHPVHTGQRPPPARQFPARQSLVDRP
jgi:hypothetical protein